MWQLPLARDPSGRCAGGCHHADRSEEVKAKLAKLQLPLLTKPIKPAQLRALLRQMEVAP